MFDKRSLLALVISVCLLISFFWMGYQIDNLENEVKYYKEEYKSSLKVTDDLTEELGTCFQIADNSFRRLKRCESNRDYDLCMDRNLWFKRAHQAVGLEVPQDQLVDCNN